MPHFPMPNDVLPGQGIVIASTHYGDHDNLATILVLRPETPYFRVGVWDFDRGTWDYGPQGYYEDHKNIVPAINGESDAKHSAGLVPPDARDAIGYQGLGGDY